MCWHFWQYGFITIYHRNKTLSIGVMTADRLQSPYFEEYHRAPSLAPFCILSK